MIPSILFEEQTLKLGYKKNGFYNIMPLENIPSVIQNGILSNELAVAIKHKSIAMKEIQCKRDIVEVTNGFPLHQYANL